MFKWNRRHKGNKFEYMLVFDNVGGDNPSTEMIGSVVVTENTCNGDITVKAECKEIDYNVEEHVDKRFIKITVENMKKLIVENLEKTHCRKS